MTSRRRGGFREEKEREVRGGEKGGRKGEREVHSCECQFSSHEERKEVDGYAVRALNIIPY
jgi:hypothetical protein